MKKIFGSLAILAILFSAVACKGNSNPGSVDNGTIGWNDSGALDHSTVTLTLTNGAKFANTLTSFNKSCFKIDGKAIADSTFAISASRDSSDSSKATLTITAPTTSSVFGKATITIPKACLTKEDGTTEWDSDVVLTDIITFNLGIASASTTATEGSPVSGNVSAWTGTDGIDITSYITLTGASWNSSATTGVSISSDSQTTTNDYTISISSGKVVVKGSNKAGQTFGTDSGTFTVTITKDAVTTSTNYKLPTSYTVQIPYKVVANE